MIQQRHPRIAALFVAQLCGQPHTTFLRAASEAPIHLVRAGFVAPTWDVLALDARPPPREPEDVEPGGVRRGWQHSAASEVEKCARDEWFMRATDQVRALVRSQGGPSAGAALTAVPTRRETTIPSHLFRSSSSADSANNSPSRAVLADVAVSSTLLATIAQHVPALGCLDAEQGAECAPTHHSHSNVGGQPPIGGLDGLPLHGGEQLAVDTTLVSTLHGKGRPRMGAADRDGVALLAATKRKERRYPEFLGARCRARLIVLAVEVGGRFSRETSDFISELAGPEPGARFR